MLSRVCLIRTFRIKELIHTTSFPCPVEFENLEHGDIVVIYEDNPIFVFERKTVADLKASIHDGRYRNPGNGPYKWKLQWEERDEKTIAKNCPRGREPRRPSRGTPPRRQGYQQPNAIPTSRLSLQPPRLSPPQGYGAISTPKLSAPNSYPRPNAIPTPRLEGNPHPNTISTPRLSPPPCSPHSGAIRTSGVAAMAVHHEPRPGRGGRDGGGLCGTPSIEGCVGARALGGVCALWRGEH